MSEKKKIKINVGSEKTAENENAEKPASPKDEYGKHKRETADKGNADVKNPLKELEARFEAKEEEAKETYDRLLRVSADFENYKKRSASVVDNLELAINSSNDKKKSDKHLIEGLNLTLNEILRVFEKFNVKPIEAQGKAFDPTFHEAVMREETDNFPENTVVSEFQKGYLIHDRLLRPAMVVVAAPKPTQKDKKT
jgi:molecular chaperone GrpE